METKNKLILWAVLFLVGLLLGFIPQYLQRTRVQAELQETQQQLLEAQQEISEREFRLRLAHLRDRVGMMHLEATRQNYGVAADHSTQYFNLLKELAGQDPDAARRSALEELMEVRDRVTGLLAKGDAAVVGEIRSLMLRTHEVTGY